MRSKTTLFALCLCLAALTPAPAQQSTRQNEDKDDKQSGANKQHYVPRPIPVPRSSTPPPTYQPPHTPPIQQGVKGAPKSGRGWLYGILGGIGAFFAAVWRWISGEKKNPSGT